MSTMGSLARASSARAGRNRRERILPVLAILVVLAVLRHTGVWVGDWLVWPLLLGAFGMALVWRPAVAGTGPHPPERRVSWREYLRGGGWLNLPRLALGVLLVVFASAALLHAAKVLHNLGDAFGVVAIVATALGMLIAPWFVRLGRNLATERAGRIREQERAEVAAHLHDSVLQTLALIQKRAGDPREVAGLARRQERELRRWLFERPGGSGGDSVRIALELAAAEVEELHGVPIEVVIVGDRPLEARLEALVPAAREAMTNAAKFAGSDRVDLYAEVGDERVEVFVRDRGAGFDPDSIPADRRGVRDSIVGRVERHGGHASIHSAPGEGTEVELAMGAPARVGGVPPR
jgi:signal transduction histidine kinase